jgi:hypothetical protein
LSLEQVSSEMHVRVERLREIENDDYSQFSHELCAHAIDYADLGIPVVRIRRLLPDRGVCASEGYQYLQDAACDYMRTNLLRRRRLLPKLAAATLLVLFSFGGFKLWVIFRDIERLGLNRQAGDQTAVSLLLPRILSPRRLGGPKVPPPVEQSLNRLKECRKSRSGHDVIGRVSQRCWRCRFDHSDRIR